MGKVIFSTNGAGATEYPHVREKNWALTLYPKQKLTQNRLTT